MPLPDGTVVGKYRVTGVLGAGNMGTVYRATDTNLGRSVALKVLADNHAHNPAFVQRFKREAEIAASLNVRSAVSVYDRGTDPAGNLWIAMEYVEGRTLADAIARDGPMAAHRALEVLSEIALAIDHAHARGLLHRDIKPANVLLDAATPGEPAKLADFGIARSMDAQLQTGSLGTWAFMAPEELNEESAQGASDVYSFACLAFNVFAARPPFAASSPAALSIAHQGEQPPDLTTFRPDLPDRINGVFARALEKDPNRRYQSAGEFVAAMRELLVGYSQSTPSVRPRAAARPWPFTAHANKYIAAMIAVVLVVLGVVVAVKEWPGSGDKAAPALPSTPWTPVSLTQQWGPNLHLEARPSRIAALGPSDAEIIKSLGVTPVIVSNGQDATPAPWADLKDVPTAGSAKDLNYEKLRAMRPDLIVDTGALTAEEFAKLSEIGPTLNRPPGTPLLRVSDRMKWIGRAIGETNAVDPVLTTVRTELASAPRGADVTGKRVAMILYDGSEYAVQGPSWPTDVLTSIGLSYTPALSVTSGNRDLLLPLTDTNGYMARVDVDLIIVLRTDAMSGGGGFGGLPADLDTTRTPIAVIDDPSMVSALLYGGPKSASVLADSLSRRLTNALEN